MASIIRIKRSSVSGNPGTLGAGELAYSALNGAGGNRLYIGMGTETAGNAANHLVIGGTYYTGLIDASTAGALTTNASSIPVLSATGTIDKWLVGNLQLTGNTLSSTNTNGNINLVPNGTGAVRLTNTTAATGSNTGALQVAGGVSIEGALYIAGALASGSASFSSINNTPIGNTTPSTGAFTTLSANSTLTVTGEATFNGGVKIGSDTLAEYIYDTVGGAVTGGTGITIANSDVGNTSTVSITNTGVTAGSYGSATAIPVLTINAQGQVTAASTANIVTSLSISGDSGTDTIALATDTLSFVGGTGIDSVVNSVANSVTFNIDSTVATLTGTQTLTNKTLTSPVLTTPTLGVATATTINKVTITAPATGSTLTIADARTLTVSNTLTLTGTDSANIAFGSGGTVAYVANKLSAFASTTSAELAGVISDETGSGSLVFATSPTLVTPTLGAALATSITATSGNLTVAAAAGNNSVNITPTGTGTVDVANKRITSVAEPTQSSDAATKNYVDAVKTGLDVKDSVIVTTTGNLTATYSNGTSGVGATLTNAGTQAALTIDSKVLTVGARVLVKDQTTALQNGFYKVTTVGTASTNWVLTRSTDADENSEITPGAFTFVEEGTVGANNGYVCTNVGAITIGTTPITFVQFSGAGSVIAGNGLTKNGNTLDVVGTTGRISISADAVDIDATYVGQTSITTLGTIGTGTWQGTIVAGQYGGTGVNNAGKTITLGGSLTTVGAFTTSLTTTANTAVTLPVSGTLATLAGSESLSNKTITASSFSGTTIAGSGLITFTNTTDAGPLGTAGVVMSGGLSVAKQIYVGTNITGAGAATSTLDGFNIDGGTY